MTNTSSDPFFFEAHGPLLKERVLAKRWDRSIRTLQRWRAIGYGPPFIQIGGSVRYYLEDVIAFEEKARRSSRGRP